MDGLETELHGRLKVVRLDAQSAQGAATAARFDLRFTPSFILLDPSGSELYRSIGNLDVQKIRQLVSFVP